MSNTFKDKSGKVLVIDSASSLRTMMTEVVKSLGFSEVQGLPSLKDALATLSAEKVAWILTSLGTDQEVNAVHLLKTLNGFSEFSETRVSLFVGEGEVFALPFLYGQGLLSHHPKATTKDDLIKGLKDFFQEMEGQNWDATLTAGVYLRRHLAAVNDQESLLKFEESLAYHYPNQPQLRMNLLDPLYKLKREQELMMNLNLLKVMLPLDDKTHTDLLKKYLGSSKPELATDAAGVNILQIKDVVVIDPDATVRKSIQDILASIGVENVALFDEGEAALAHLEAHPNPDVIIHEWRLPKVPGPVFLQRVKTKHAVTTPLLVVSSLIQSGEMHLVREMGVAKVVSKPLDKEIFLRNVIEAVQQGRVPTERAALERKIRSLLRQGNLPEARHYLDDYAKDPSISAGMKMTLEAEYTFSQGNYERARDLGVEALKLAGDSLFVLNLLGKAMANLRDFESALKCFSRAQSLSPNNIERLCHMADAQAEMGKTEVAKDTLDTAKDLDMSSSVVKESEVKVAMAESAYEVAKSLMSELESLDNIVSYLNNQAVVLAKMGKIAEGMDQYDKALRSIPDDRKQTRATVSYNLGLAQVKAGKLQDAVSSLRLCMDHGHERLRKKAGSLLRRVETAIKEGKPLTLQSAEAGLAKAGDSGKEAEENKTAPVAGAVEGAVAVGNKPKDRCCHLIFEVEQILPEIKKLEEGMPHFALRGA